MQDNVTQPDADVLLAARGLRKSFGRGPARVEVLRGLDLTVRGGEFLAVMGPSGCGKSTLLHVLGLITMAEAGEVWIAGQRVTASGSQRTRLRRDAIGLIFQRLNLLPTLTALDNVKVSLSVRNRRYNGTHGSLFERMGVSHVMDRRPHQMSIGEQQRVAAVRALAHSPALLLADEPTGSLDTANETALLELLREINRRDGQTIVMITHSPEAAAVADRVVHMVDGHMTDAETAP